MVDRNLIREFNIDEEEFERTFSQALTEGMEAATSGETRLDMLYHENSNFDVGGILPGVVLRVEGDNVLVDVGYKSEGIVPLGEWEEEEETPVIGQKIEVLLEEVEDAQGLILLSKRKAARIRSWETVIAKYKENDIVSGMVVRKIKGGMLVDIGVNVFLPASQIDIRRPSDINDYVGKTIECVILKIDEARRNIVVSRRKMIEDQREEMKRNLMSQITVGEIRKGIVKNIADFGAFVDLGGIDGLLHITDMSYGRINHPTEMVKIDDEIEVMILNVDTEREKIALGLKQKFPSPWEMVAEKFPVGTKVEGEVVNVMSYGAFVKLEEGIEGLVHISEMSWTKRINHPSELVQIGDKVEVVVLGISKEKQEISLGMKQTQSNPWDNVAGKYPPGTMVQGTVRNLTNYGAFIEIEEGIDGLLHVSDMSWTRKISHASEMLQKGDKIECQVISVDQERKRIALGLKQLHQDPWSTTIPEKYTPNSLVTGTVTKLTNFGVFVELEPSLEGLLHISELSDKKIENPEDIVKVGDQIEVRILRVDIAERKIGLSRKSSVPVEEGTETDQNAAPAVPREELKGGTGESSGPLFSMGGGE
ncbi:MAG: 30S ribosomal protein S1 [Planctomycetaceae bacterium]|nr:30S ribosomal protein S1 [Planctomycetaceae bacterium]